MAAKMRGSSFCKIADRVRALLRQRLYARLARMQMVHRICPNGGHDFASLCKHFYAKYIRYFKDLQSYGGVCIGPNSMEGMVMKRHSFED